MAWLKPPYYELPAEPPATSIVEWDLADLISNDIKSAALNFLAANPQPQYANPGAYIANLIQYAKTLAAGASSPAAKFLAVAGYAYMPDGWEPVTAAIKYAMTVFTTIQGIAVNLGDEASASVYDAWVNHAGQYYGGHLPAAPAPPDTGLHPETGQSAAPQSPML